MLSLLCTCICVDECGQGKCKQQNTTLLPFPGNHKPQKLMSRLALPPCPSPCYTFSSHFKPPDSTPSPEDVLASCLPEKIEIIRRAIPSPSSTVRCLLTFHKMNGRSCFVQYVPYICAQNPSHLTYSRALHQQCSPSPTS